MSAAKSGALQSKADYYQPYEDQQLNWISTPQQWSQYDNYTIIRRFNTQSFVSGSTGQIAYYSVPDVVLSCATTNSYELEYAIIVYNYRNEKFFESDWYDNNTFINCTLTDFRWNGYSESANTQNITWIWEIWVRRKDGNTLSRQDMLPCSFALTRYFNQTVKETTALPQNWFETTTQSIPTYTTQTTMVTTVDYESFLTTLTVPVDIRPAIAQFDQIINDLWSLHYIPFLVCFALIMGLAIWLLH